MNRSSRLGAGSVGLFAVAIVGLGLDPCARGQSVEIELPERPASEAPPAPPPEAPPTPRPYAPPPSSPDVPPTAAPSDAVSARRPSAPPEAIPPTRPEARPGAPAFGVAWHYAISIERAAGIDHLSQTESIFGQESSKTTATNFSLFGVSSAGAFSSFSFPRGAFDLFVAPDFSVGLALGFVYGSASVTQSGGGSNDQTFTGILAMPRGGFAWHLTPEVTLWTRAGVSVVYLKTSAANGYGYVSQATTEHFVAATVELPVVFALAPRVAFTVGPTLDVSFVGHKTYPCVDDCSQPNRDEHVTEVGVQAGLLIDL